MGDDQMWCLLGCADNADCDRPEGTYACYGGGADPVCWSCLVTDVRVGRACNAGADCGQTGAFCLSEADYGFPGGYCTTDADAFCCPDGSVVVPLEDGGFLCGAGCRANADCRAGYECVQDFCWPV